MTVGGAGIAPLCVRAAMVLDGPRQVASMSHVPCHRKSLL